MDAGNSSPESKRKRNRRSRKKKNKSTNGDNQTTDPNNVNKSATKKKGRQRPHDDRYFGRFHCKKCDRHWDSAHVYTLAGTKKVKFRQRCKECEDSWLFPYSLQILRCSICEEHPCMCKCDKCGKLKHIRFVEIKTDQGNTEKVVDTDFQYCRCEKNRKVPVGQYIDPKKNHRSDLCQKCMKGRPCVYAQSAKDNEP